MFIKNLFLKSPQYLLLFVLGFLYYFFVLVNHTSLEYNYQYYLYDYQFGFIKRGFIGSLINFLPFRTSFGLFKGISTIMIIIIGIIIVKIVDYIDFKNKFFGYFLVSLLVVNPSLLKNFWFDLGRFDIYGILMCLLIIYPFKKNISTIILLFSPTILFIHEGFFILWLPTYYVCWLIKNQYNIKNRNVKFSTFIFVTFSFLLMILISLNGKLSVDFHIFESYIRSKSSLPNISVTDYVITTKENEFLNSFIENFTHMKFWFLGITSILSMIYIVYLFCKLLKIDYSKYKIIYIPLFFSFFMFFLGIDALRWFSNMNFSIYLILLAILISNKELLNNNEPNFIRLNFNDIFYLILLLLLFVPFNKLGLTSY